MNSTLNDNENTTSEWQLDLQKSEIFLIIARKTNICATLSFILFGIIGNILLISVFLKEKFRINSSNVYMLSLAVNNTLFLMIHLEEISKSFVDVFGEFDQESQNETARFYNYYIYKIAMKLNLTDNFSFACSFFNYLRHVLRFNSSYIILAFTCQRLSLLISSSSEKKLNSKKLAWKTVTIIGLVSLVFNSWVLIIFKTQTQYNIKYCNVDAELKEFYFYLTIIFTLLIIVAPIFIITISLLFICFKLLNQKTNASLFGGQGVVKFNFRSKKHYSNVMHTFDEIPIAQSKRFNLESYFIGVNQMINRISNKTNNSIKITKVLVLIATLYATFNIPYLVISLVFFDSALLNSPISKNYMFGAVQFAEIFYGNIMFLIVYIVSN